jgi:transposase
MPLSNVQPSTTTGSGNPWLRAALIETAWAAARCRRSYFATQYHRLAARRGAKRAVVAVAHSILTVIYHLLCDGTVYQDLGSNYFDERNRQAVTRHAVRRLERLGYNVALAPTN